MNKNPNNKILRKIVKDIRKIKEKIQEIQIETVSIKYFSEYEIEFMHHKKSSSSETRHRMERETLTRGNSTGSET